MKRSTLRAALGAVGVLAIWAGAAQPRPATPVSADTPTALTQLLWSEDVAPVWIDQSGQILEAATLHDKVVVLAFLKTECFITCVVRILDLDKVTRALPETARQRMAVLGITVDPARDDVGNLRRFAEGLNIDAGRIRLIRSIPSATTAVTNALHYPAAQADNPPSTILVFDRRGQVAMTYGGDPLDGPRLSRDLLQLIHLPDGVGQPARSETVSSLPL